MNRIPLFCYALLCFASSAFGQVAVATFAGSTPAIQAGSANGSGTSARFNGPAGIAVDASGNIYVADATNHRIRRVSPDGVVTTLAGSGTAGSTNGTGTSARFNFPQGITTDGTYVYVADTANHAIRRIVISSGVVATLAGAAGSSGITDSTGTSARFNGPRGVVLDGSDLYIADTSNHLIRKIVVSTGAVTTIAGTAGLSGSFDGIGAAALFLNPSAIASDGAGTLYIADSGNHTIRKLVLASGAVTTLAGVAAGPGGNDSNGLAASFRSPNQLTVTGDKLYVVDTGNHTIRQIALASSGAPVSTVAGGTGLPGGTDGLGPVARFNGPTGIAVTSGGNLCIADTLNHRIRLIAPAIAPTVSSPTSAVVLVGAAPSFTVATSGNPFPTIQWERQAVGSSGFVALTDGGPYSGTSSGTLTISAATLAMSGDQFRASVNNGVGSATNSALPATLTVQLAPVITSANAVSFAAGFANTFKITATGTPAPTYSVISGVFPAWATLDPNTGVIVGTPPNTSVSPYVFTIQAANGAGVAASQVFTLTVVNAPVVTSLSAPRQVVAINQSFTLSVSATGVGSFQWKRNGQPIAGATGANYTVGSANPLRDNGWYQVLATNTNGSAASSGVFVAVNVPTAVFAWGDNSYGQSNIPADLANIIAVSAGSFHNIALRADGTVVGWGHEGSGKTAIPAGLTGVVAVAAGAEHSIALKGDGTVVGWGAVSVPSNLAGVVAISAGDYHSLALKSDGTVVAWGATPESVVPTALSGIVAIAAGNRHSLALRTDGTVVGWGIDNAGQATNLASEFNLVAISAGYFHNVAIRSDGTLVGGPSGAFATISARGAHSLGLNAEGNIFAWGSDNYGESAVPSGLSRIIAIAAGDRHSLALHDAATDSAPEVISPLQNQSANVGKEVIFGGSANYRPTTVPQRYQWRKDGVNISGATHASYAIGGVSRSDAGSYDVVISNYLGSAISNAAALVVNSSPVVNATDPGRYVLASGESLTLALAASVNATASVQWKRNGRPITGATTRTYVIANASRSSAGYYQAVYNEGSGAVVSAPIFVLVAPAETQVVGWGSGSTTIPSVSSRFVEISLNQRRNAGLLADGRVVTWNGAAPPAGLANCVAVSAGFDHYLALRSDGTVTQWGDTSGGQSSPPLGLSGVVSIAAGSQHSLAVKGDGSVVAWGNPSYGATAVPADLAGVVAIAAGNGFSLALLANGTVVGWGNNASNQSSIPPGLNNVSAIRAGNNFSLALKGDGLIAAWGASGTGPAAIPAGLVGIVEIAAGNSHALALRSDGTVMGWGENSSGQILAPVSLNSVIAVGAGYQHSLALRDSTGDLAPSISVQPVGRSAFPGQSVSLAVSASGGTALLSYQWRKTGIPINGATGATLLLPLISAANAGDYDVVVTNQRGTVTSQIATLAVASASPVFTNLTGQQTLGLGQSLTLSATNVLPGPVTYQWRRSGRPIAGATNASFTIGGATWRDTGAYQVIVSNSVGPVASSPVYVTIAGTVQLRAWGNDSLGQATVPAGLTGSVAGVAAGAQHSIVLKSDGTVVAWGNNASGQINLPAGLSQVVAVDAGVGYSMALRADGRVVTWGSINYTPVELADVIAISAGNAYAMALRANGTVAAWTSGGVATDIPSGLSDVVAIASGGNHRLALKSDGTVTAWGSTVAAPAGLGGVIAIAAGESSSLALKADGSVVAWGGNGSFGEGNVPAGLSDVVSITAGQYNSYAVKSDGSVVAWGNSGYSLNATASVLTNVIAIAAGHEHVLALRDPSSDAAPSIVSQPVSRVAATNQSATFSVVVSGNPTPTFQWRLNGAAISGATSASFAVVNAQTYHAGSYDVVASNYLGSVVSAAATLAVGTPPAFSTQAASRSIGIGGTTVLSASVVGSSPLSYQWRRNGTAILNATDLSLRLNDFQVADAGDYSMVATNPFGSATSGAATLTAAASVPPVIASATGSGTIASGLSTGFNVSVTGTTPIYYQWRKDGTPITSGTNANYVLTNVSVSDSGSYDVVVSNSGGSAASSGLQLTVTPPVAPAIVTQPAGAVLNVGNVGNLGVVATGTPSPVYQWRKDGTPLSGATQNVLRLGQVVEAQAGTYDVVVSNLAGSVTSASAVLVINPASISILSQPVSLSTWLGATATFSITATGIPGPPTYQWRKNAVNIPGATASTLSFSAVQLADAGTYDVVATNGYVTLTSASANLAITDAAPVVLTPPAGFTLAVGGSASLSVTAGGSAPLAYQWRRGSFTLPGATTATLPLTNAQTFDAGDYTVTITNGLGSVTSAPARVNVVPRVVAYSARVILDDSGAVAAFVIEGALPKKVLLRAVGPGLAPFGLTGLPDPALELFDSSGNLLALNDDWSTSADAVQIASTAAAVGAFALAQGGKDAALVRTLVPGAYTVRARPATGAGGVGYLELYDADLATGPLSTVPFVAVRGRMAAGGGVVIGGLGSNGRGQRSYLLRAVGPGLGLAGALADPALLVVRDSALVGQNDNWDAVPADATAVATATSRVAAFPLTTASRDAGIVLAGNLHVGSATAQISGADNLGGLVLVELHDLDAARPTSFRPVIVSPPVPTTAVAGNSATLRVRAHGTAPLGYQWHRNGVPVAGATADTLVLAGVTGSVAGPYTVTVANSLGSSTSVAALLTVTSSTDTSTASHAVIGGGYAAGAPVTISAQLVASAGASALGWSVDLPPGWSYVSDTATSAAARPAAGATGTIEWAWSEVPAGGTLNFTFTASVPSGSSGDRTVTARGLVRFESGLVTTLAAPSPLTVNHLTLHTADLNADNRLDLAELLRVIQLYNARAGGVRTGAYAVATTTSEDGFAPDLVRTGATTLTRYHSADTTRDGRLNLIELTRVIELYNVRAGTVRTGLYKIQPGTEDGFGLGP